MGHPYAHLHPFGSVEASTDADLLDLFVRVPHALKATDPSVAVLTGRRAAGKTAVAVFLEKGPDPGFDVVVHFDKKKLLTQLLLLDERDRLNRKRNAAVVRTALTSDQFVDYWLFALWHGITSQLLTTQSFLSVVDKALFQVIAQEVIDLSSTADDILYAAVADQYTRDVALLRILQITGEFRKSYTFDVLEKMVQDYLNAGYRIIVVADTIEDYRVRNELVDRALSGLLTAWAGFAGKINNKNLHVKCFFPAEIYSYLKIGAPFNIRKVEQHMVHLRWTPKQLRKMLSKRLGHWLYEHHPEVAIELGLPDATEANLDKIVWSRLFPSTVVNKQGIEEDTFIYVARHTQLHPGQLIWLCNVIAEKASDDECFPPRILSRHVIAGVNDVESEIATSVLAPYSPVYPNIAKIFQEAFEGSPNLISYRDFSELYKKALHVWPQSDYEADRHTFERMALESGVVGKLRKETDKYYVAYFEYDSKDELRLRREDLCAVHPAFYDFLAINPSNGKKFVCPHVVMTDDL
jgi:hypothetical protein